MNTLDLDHGSDAFATGRDVARWLAANGLAEREPRVAAADLTRVNALRDALRVLLLANNDVRDPGAERRARNVLDEAAATARLRVRFRAGGETGLEPEAGGVDGALGRLLVIVAGAMEDGTWTRLKACRAGDCQWAFYDCAKNQSRAWCSMKVCGNREKARRFRAQHAHE